MLGGLIGAKRRHIDLDNRMTIAPQQSVFGPKVQKDRRIGQLVLL